MEKETKSPGKGIFTESLARQFFIAMIIIFGLSARGFLMPTGSPDQDNFIGPWFETIDELGPAGALKNGLGDYMPPYYWIMILVNALPISNKIVGLKWVSCLADLIAAFFIMKTVRKLTGSETKAELSFAAAFMMPSVILDSAAWGQCDSIFTLFLIMCVYFLISGRDFAALTCFSVSFVFKQQAIFLVPLLIVMLFKKQIRRRTLLMFPAVYIAAILPSAVCGHDIPSLFTGYFSQASQYDSLNMTLPNIWSVFGDFRDTDLGRAGVMFAGAFCLTGIYYLCRRKQIPGIRGTAMLAAMSALFVPYLLPFMHERYYYPAALLSLPLVFLDKRLAPVWFVIEYASAASMIWFLFDREPPDLRFTALLVTAALVMLFVGYCRLDGKDEPIRPASAMPETEAREAAETAETNMQQETQESPDKGAKL